ncbi:MAG: TonB-dependent receptor [Prevotellaceae bacterium]|jgi:outer membrane receptor for ferrienterochelin and colicins|nr:TonB-dependent receptor [Prevotellaceae bacterium]
MTKAVFFTTIALLLTQSAYSQAVRQKIYGKITTKDNAPAESITVLLKGSSYGTTTDEKGEFSFEAPAGKYTMVVYSIIAHAQEFPVTIKSDAENYFSDLKIIEKAQDLEDVVVTGTRTEKRLSESPILTTVIRDREMYKAGSVSMLESLQDNIPGIVITPNGMGNNMRIKGLNSRYILLLVDGERLVSEGAGGNINLDQIDVSTIKRIEMVDGASSALYGSNAIGAVINVIAKEPVHKIEIGANQSLENYNTLRTRVAAGTAQKKYLINTGFFRNSSDGFDNEESGASAARYTDYGGSLKLGYKPTVKSAIAISGRYFQHETFNPDNSMSVKHPFSQNLTIGANGGLISPNDKNRFKVSVNFDKYFEADILEKKNNERKLKNTVSYISSRITNAYTLSEKWEFIGGLEYNYEYNYSTTTLGHEPTSKSVDDMNAFGQAQYNPFKNFNIIAGGRYIYSSQFGSEFTPKLSLMYSIAGFQLRGGIGTAFRAPSIKELYYDFDHQGMFWVYGNPDLKPEKGLYPSFSAEYTNGSFNASVSGYHNEIDNKITQYDVINEGRDEKYYKNVSSATLQGVDVSIAYTLFRKLTLKGSYSYCDAVDNSTGLQLPSNVEHSGAAAATWNGSIFKSPFSLQFSGRLNSPILYQEMVTGSNGNQVAEKKESKMYSIWKLTLVKPFNFKKQLLELTFKVDNIFDFRDTAFINPGRQYLAGIRYNFKT